MSEKITDVSIQNAKPTTKPQKLFYEKGMFLLVTPAGGKWWRLKYRFHGKEKQLSLGAYPAVSLADARARRDEAKRLLANGVDPSEKRKDMKNDMKNVSRFAAEIQFMRDKITEIARLAAQKKLSLEVSIGVRATGTQKTGAEIQHIGAFVLNCSDGEQPCISDTGKM